MFTNVKAVTTDCVRVENGGNRFSVKPVWHWNKKRNGFIIVKRNGRKKFVNLPFVMVVR